jgi:PKD repeat protein
MKISYLILTLLVFNILNTEAQTADFTFSTTNNLFCTPQVVTFAANATGGATAYIWDFGDGLSGSASVESHLYDYPGTYNVTFTAVYANSASSITKAIVINPSPTVSLSPNRSSLCQPGAVTFNASASGPMSSYEWDFGDASALQTTTTNSTAHNFTGYGTFNTTVKAISSAGCTATSTIAIQIARFPINVSVTPPDGCLPVNATLALTATFPPGDGLQNIVWDFGDGTPGVTGNAATIVHQYNTTNPITNANVAVTSNQGCTNQYNMPVHAYGIPPTNTNAYTTALRDTFCGSETIQFYGFADSANSYKWDFGDGNTQVTAATQLTHKYSTLGDKLVVVTPYYNGCVGPARSLNIYITGVIAAYTYSNTCSNKATYSFINNSLGPVSAYEWAYSDVPGFYETTNYSPVHVFPSNGTSVVKLTVIDNASGCRDSLSATIYTATPSFVSDKINVCKDSAITYSVQNSYPAGTGYSYEYHLNNYVYPLSGNSSITINPREYGSFNDYAVIRDTLGNTCDDTLHLGIINVRGPYVTFTHPFVKCFDSAVTFTNNSYPWFAADSIVKWRWDFRDGIKDSVRNPAPHSFLVTGHHTVKLLATDVNGCAIEFGSVIYNAPIPIIKVLPAMDTLCLGQSATLMAYTSDSTIWVTNTNCISCDTVSVSPAITTDYIVMALSEFSCKGYDTATVKVFTPLNLAVTPAQTSVCAGVPVSFNLNVAGITTWSPPTFLNNPGIRNPVAIPDSSITYTIRVKDSVGCFTDSVTASIIVFSNPQVDAGPDRFLGYNTSFTLSPAYGPGTQTYLWTPAGNLSCNNCPSPTGIASQKQEYVVEITDANNCKAKDSVIIFVSCEKSNLLLPSAFTPNGDGRNETFYPAARGYKIIKSFTIFNRNGVKVFERKNFQPNIPAEGWDGRVNVQGENIQSYVWVIEGICDTGMSIVTKGTVILIR